MSATLSRDRLDLLPILRIEGKEEPVEGWGGRKGELSPPLALSCIPKKSPKCRTTTAPSL